MRRKTNCCHVRLCFFLSVKSNRQLRSSVSLSIEIDDARSARLENLHFWAAFRANDSRCRLAGDAPEEKSNRAAKIAPL